MALFILTYDLNKEKDYNKLIKELEAQKCHRILMSVWLCNLDNTTQEVHDHFKGFMDGDDSLVVAKTQENTLWFSNAKNGTNNWLNKRQ